LKKHNKTFLDWFKDTIFVDENASTTLRKLVDGPKRNVITWQGYDINKYSFYTKAQDEKSTMQNSGVTFRDESQHFASVHDDNPCVAFIPLVSLKKFGSLIMSNLLFVFSNVNELTVIPVCGPMM